MGLGLAVGVDVVGMGCSGLQIVSYIDNCSVYTFNIHVP